MAADAKGTLTKITYATMTADRMEDLHRELRPGLRVLARQVRVRDAPFHREADPARGDRGCRHRVAYRDSAGRGAEPAEIAGLSL